MFINKAIQVILIENIEVPKNQAKVLKQIHINSTSNTRRRKNQIVLNF